MGHTLLEDHMRLVDDRHIFQHRRECIPRLGLVCGEELFSHEGLPNNKILPDSLEHVEDPWDIVGQRNVDGLDLWPKWNPDPQ